MSTILTGTDRRQRPSNRDFIRLELRNKQTALAMLIPKNSEGRSKTAGRLPKPGATELIPDNDFCLDDFLAKQDTGIVSGGKCLKEQ